MTRTKLLSLALIGMASAGAVLLIAARGSVSHADPVSAMPEKTLVAGPGRVEPVSEEINLGSEISGRLKQVLVEEGDHVERGQIVAVIENDDYIARVSAAEADLTLKEAALRRVINGARRQERREAAAAVKEAEAVMENARVEQHRRLTGYQQGVFAKEEADRAEREFGVAVARHQAALERYNLIEDDPREEDRTRAEADVALARAHLEEARARLEKTVVRAPVSGLILRKRLKAGESFSDQRNIPIITMGDFSTLRVRVDVDETDISKLRLGQRAYVTADAYGPQKFWGRVVRLGQVLGKKNILTDEPSERVDTKILEALIELEPGAKLPPGLRVDAFILVKE